jgi:hypothetical protein
MRFITTVSVLAALCLGSCVKTRTCDCTRTTLSSGATKQDTYTVKTKKKFAKEACKDYVREDGFEKVTCELK